MLKVDSNERARRVAVHRAPARALDILMSNETLRASYLLQFAGDVGAPSLDEEIAERFLLWFAVEGRHKYQQVLLSPSYVTFLSEPRPPFVTRLAAYVHSLRSQAQRPSEDDVEAFHAWYYVTGVHHLRLAPLLVARERSFLSERHPRLQQRGDNISRWNFFRFLAHTTTDERFHNADRATRDAANWLAANPDNAAMGLQYPRPAVDRSRLPGINIIGSADGVSGIGEDARALTEVLLRAGIQHSIFNVRYPAEIVTTEQSWREAYFVDRPIYPINVFCLPAFETARLKLLHGNSLFAGRHNVGYWPWELTSLPPAWDFAFDLVDEIWASSRFLLEVFGKLTEKSVNYMPPHVGVPDVTPFAREDLGLSQSDMIFLCMFDFNSYLARKNPIATIEAFKIAFPSRNGQERLLIKTLNGHASPQALSELEQYVATDDRIILIDGSLTRDEVCGLLQGVDCYVSLHRSEGFGRIIAEAMLLGTPVIATDWSGSASFVNQDTGFPVSYALRKVRSDEYVYCEGSLWAEPSTEDAALKMRSVRQDRRKVEAVRNEAARAMLRTYGLDAAASRVSEWLTAFDARGPRR